jgi:hypothetical protein
MVMGSESNQMLNDTSTTSTSVGDSSWTTIYTITVPKELMKSSDSQIRAFFVSFEVAGPGHTGQSVRITLNGEIKGATSYSITSTPTYTPININMAAKQLNSDNVILVQAYDTSGGSGSYSIKNIIMEARYAVIER